MFLQSHHALVWAVHTYLRTFLRLRDCGHSVGFYGFTKLRPAIEREAVVSLVSPVSFGSLVSPFMAL